MKYITRCILTLAYAYSAAVLSSPDAAASLGNISKVNGSVQVGPAQQAGNVSTVNGSVSVGAGARAESIETVNGSIRIAERALLQSAETVNGAVTVGAGGQVSGGIETVNGDVTLHTGARARSIENVNGDMLLDGAELTGGIETVNGDIRLATGSRVAGDIRVNENKSWLKTGKSARNPRITLEQGAVVEGRLILEREVDLYVAPGVTVPQVEGTAPRRFVLN